VKKTGFARHLSGLLALLACLVIVASTGACGPALGKGEQSPSAPQSLATPTAAAEVPGTVAIFTPSDGITLSQHTPINKWAALIPELKAALSKEHLSNKRIDAYTSGNLEDQSKELQDYVVNRLSERKAGKSSEPTTLVVAPMPSSTARLSRHQVTITRAKMPSLGENDLLKALTDLVLFKP